jgi:hypothetical protein
MSSITFPPLAGTNHRFVLRHPKLPMDVDRAEALIKLAPWHHSIIAGMGCEPSQMHTAEQVHGAKVAIVDDQSPAQFHEEDGLITQSPSVLLGIYVADCAAVYLHDPVQHAVGLVHSGKKGTELGIVPRAIAMMCSTFHSDAKDIIVQISPCIRPPAYEVDFAAQIRAQCLDAGIAPEHLHDDGTCTSSDPTRYYSYRLEKGRTGRMLALLGLKLAS